SSLEPRLRRHDSFCAAGEISWIPAFAGMTERKFAIIGLRPNKLFAPYGQVCEIQLSSRQRNREVLSGEIGTRRDRQACLVADRERNPLHGRRVLGGRYRPLHRPRAVRPGEAEAVLGATAAD